MIPENRSQSTIMFSLKDLELIFQLNPANLMNWVKLGVLTPQRGVYRSGRGHRLEFDKHQAARAVIITGLRERGYSLDEVREELLKPKYLELNQNLLPESLQSILGLAPSQTK